jgi:hypothetical protein
VALINTDPAKAWERLQPTIQQLQEFKGEVLPNDLKSDVDEGLLTIERAKEIATLRQQTKRGQEQQQLSAQQQQQLAVQRRISDCQTALKGWQENVMQRDPDFTPKQGDDAPDGKYEWVMDKSREMIRSAMDAGQINGPADVVKLVEKAYATVGASIARFQPKKEAKRSLSSTRSSSTANRQPSSLAEAIRMKAAELGVE